LGLRPGAPRVGPGGLDGEGLRRDGGPPGRKIGGGLFYVLGVGGDARFVPASADTAATAALTGERPGRTAGPRRRTATARTAAPRGPAPTRPARSRGRTPPQRRRTPPATRAAAAGAPWAPAGRRAPPPPAAAR